MLESLREHDNVEGYIRGDRTGARLTGKRRALLGRIRRARLERRASSRRDVRSAGKHDAGKKKRRALHIGRALLVADDRATIVRHVAFTPDLVGLSAAPCLRLALAHYRSAPCRRF